MRRIHRSLYMYITDLPPTHLLDQLYMYQLFSICNAYNRATKLQIIINIFTYATYFFSNRTFVLPLPPFRLPKSRLKFISHSYKQAQIARTITLDTTQTKFCIHAYCPTGKIESCPYLKAGIKTMKSFQGLRYIRIG